MDLLNDTYEREIIAMMLGDRLGNKEFIIKSLSEKMFINRFYRKIFEICAHLLNSGKEINVYNVCEVLSEEETKQAIKQIYSEFITNVNSKFYIEKLQGRYFDSLVENAKTVKEMEDAKAEIEKWQDTTSLVDISAGAENLICEYYENWETAVKTYYPSIDNEMGSLQGGDFIVFAGCTSMGKTCMMLNLVTNMAKNGKKVDLFSLEMTLSQLQNRVICSEIGLSASKFRTFTLNAQEQDCHMEYAKTNFKKLPIKVCTEYNLKIDKIRKIVKKSDSDIVFIDYLGLISGFENKASYERVSTISRSLKLLALETNKPFFVLHQLSRDIFNRQDKRPRISDLRDSGKIEQDADMICFVHRPAYFEPEQYSKDELQFIISKNRHGECNVTVDLSYQASTQKVRERVQVR